MNRYLCSLGLCSLLVADIGPGRPANAGLINGSFEQGIDGLQGWLVANWPSEVAFTATNFDGYVPTDGKQFLVIETSNTTERQNPYSLFATFQATAGQRISFDYATLEKLSGPGTFTDALGMLQTTSQSVVLPLFDVRSNTNGWQTATFTIPQSGSYDLMFFTNAIRGWGSSSSALLIDDCRLIVPEPEGLAIAAAAAIVFVFCMLTRLRHSPE